MAVLVHSNVYTFIAIYERKFLLRKPVQPHYHTSSNFLEYLLLEKVSMHAKHYLALFLMSLSTFTNADIYGRPATNSNFWYLHIRLVKQANIQIFTCFQRNVGR